MSIKKGDFVELNFTGKVAETGKIFDTTSSDVAKKNNIFQEKGKYEAITIVVGENHLLPGLDHAMEGKNIGSFKVKLNPDDAFGKKSAKLLKIIPMKNFKKQNLKPFVGLEINVDGTPGTVRNVSGGRTIVDFNHPLAGKELEYEVNVKKIITNDKEKLEGLFKFMGMIYKDLKVEGKKATLTTSSKLPEQAEEQLGKEIERLTGLKTSFKNEEKKEN